MVSPYELDQDSVKLRQRRLVEAMDAAGLDWVILTQIPHVYWLTGARFKWTFEPAAAISKQGHVLLVGPRKQPEEAVCDEREAYDAQWLSTMRNDQRAASSEVFLKLFASHDPGKRIGVEFSSFSQHLAGPLRAKGAELLDIEPTMYQLRRKKSADELAKIRKAIDGTRVMYERARQIIKPGVSEIEVYNELQSVCVEEFGEPWTETGNDYRCGARGGSPRDGRLCEPGELYILDLGPAFRGYFADNSRAIAVTEPTREQLAAWEVLQQSFRHIEATARPGKSCRELFAEVDAMVNGPGVGVFNHHLGHGIGLFPHEGPHLNPNWDDMFEVGDVFTCEPGLYSDAMRQGMRLENDYLITEAGIENLSPFPMELKL